jgi:hypothetical protein
MNFRNRPTFAGVPERYKEHLAALIPTDIPLHVSGPLIDNEVPPSAPKPQTQSARHETTSPVCTRSPVA